MSKIKIFSLGGLNENGKNMYIVEVDDNIFVFDAGLKYPTTGMLGVDYIIPKFDYLINNKKRIKGIFISHGHVGNCGALVDILKELPDVNVYATKFTMNLIKEELQKEKVEVKANILKEIRPHSKIDVDGYTIFPISVTHSMPETVMYVLYTNDGAICYATDFVFDSTMLGSYKTDIGKLAYVGKQGVLCLMSESMFAYREGHTSPKHRISKIVWDTLNKTDNRIIISVFPNHLYRIQEIFDQISRTRRKVVLMGKKLTETVEKGVELKYLDIDTSRIGDLSNINDKDVVILTSDDKEKPFGSLEKIESGYDKYLKFKDTDTVLISEPVYPGCEKKHSKIVDDLARENVEVVSFTSKDHLTHHASKEDLMLMLNLMNPKYYFPIKGEYRYMYMNANVASEIGMNDENIILKLNGEVETFVDGKLTEDKEKIPTDEILIDGSNSDDIGNLVLKDRELLSKNGIVIVSATLDRKTKKILANPEILTRGFIYVKDNLDMVQKSQEICKDIIESNAFEGQKVDFNKIKNLIREKLGDYFEEETGSIPMIITVVTEI